MKKIIVLSIISSVLISCNRDYRNFTITDFSQKRIDTLIPYEHKTYVSFVVKVRGCVNDTIKIKGEYNISLSGKIDTLLNGDYYGTHDVICIFDPYIATEGELEIEYSL